MLTYTVTACVATALLCLKLSCDIDTACVATVLAVFKIVL
jgi:hypothetical protein